MNKYKLRIQHLHICRQLLLQWEEESRLLGALISSTLCNTSHYHWALSSSGSSDHNTELITRWAAGCGDVRCWWTGRPGPGSGHRAQSPSSGSWRSWSSWTSVDDDFVGRTKPRLQLETDPYTKANFKTQLNVNQHLTVRYRDPISKDFTLHLEDSREVWWVMWYMRT